MARESLSFSVIGTPAPQGSKRHVGNGVMVESSKHVKPWRDIVAFEARLAHKERPALDGPLFLRAQFLLPRPVSLTRKQREMGPCRKPDLDKLLRSTLDALTTAGVIADDARIIDCVVSKRYVRDGESCGARIFVDELLVSVEPERGKAEG